MIRQSTKSDIPSIEALMKSVSGFWDERWRDDVVERVLSKTTNEFIIALGSPVKVNNKNIGFVGGTIKLSLINDIINSEKNNIDRQEKSTNRYQIQKKLKKMLLLKLKMSLELHIG